MGGIFAILGRRFIWIVLTLAVSLMLAAAYIMLAPLSYTSTISILVDSRDRQPLGSDAQPLPQTPDPILVDSQVKLMTSEAVLRRVVAAEQLEADPDYAPRERQPGLLDPVTRMFDRGRVTPPAVQQIVDRLATDISVKRPDRTYVFDIDVRAANPAKAARIANALANAFIAEERAATDAQIQQQTDWIVRHTAELRNKLEAAEKRVQDYKAANGIVNVAGTLTNEQQLQDANRDLVAARAKTAEAQSRADQIRRIISSGHALDGTYDTINSTVIRQLRVQYSDLARREAAATQKYGTRHPEYLDIQEQLSAVRSQITSEMQRVALALANEVQVAKGNEEAAQKRVATLESRSTSTNETLLKLKELDREAESNRVNYEKFLRVGDGIRRDMIDTPYGRILAPANVPSRPSSPKVMAAILIAVFGGFSLGVGLALTIDYGATPAAARRTAGTDDAPDTHQPPPAGPAGPPSRVGRSWLSRAKAMRRDAPERRPLVPSPAPESSAPAVAPAPPSPEPSGQMAGAGLTHGLELPVPPADVMVLPPPPPPPVPRTDTAAATDGDMVAAPEPMPVEVDAGPVASDDPAVAAAPPADVAAPMTTAASAPPPVAEFAPAWPHPVGTLPPAWPPVGAEAAAVSTDASASPVAEATGLPESAPVAGPAGAAALRPTVWADGSWVDGLGRDDIDVAACVAAFEAAAVAGLQPRLMFTAPHDLRMKSDLALSVARTVAGNGRSVLLVDGDVAGGRLTRLAAKDGRPATIPVDGADLDVLGLPGPDGGVVFVLPHSAALVDIGDEARPFIDCTVAAIVVDGPLVGAQLAGFAPLIDAALMLDDTGRLSFYPMSAQSEGAETEQMRQAVA